MTRAPIRPNPDLTAHAPDCASPRFLWQAALAEHLARRGYCPSCGATAVTDRTPPPIGKKPNNPRGLTA